MPDEVRRIVTGHGADGRSRVVADSAAPRGDPRVYVPDGNPGTCLTDLWTLAGLPTRFDTAEPSARMPFRLSPPAGGLVFRMVEVPPDSERNFEAMPAYFAKMADHGALDAGNARHPAMHRTDTVDFAVVLKGEVVLILDEGEVALEAGDVVIQRGTNHAWSNRSAAPCLFACVLIDATGDATKDAAGDPAARQS
jgi:mannose-6-phosphate isomerase-like protein (cupin superfamily)